MKKKRGIYHFEKADTGKVDIREMITSYKYIYFVKIMDKAKTSVWQCRSKRNDGLLGIVRWYGPWRQYCFIPESGTIFNISCNENINDFIRQLAQERLI